MGFCRGRQRDCVASGGAGEEASAHCRTLSKSESNHEAIGKAKVAVARHLAEASRWILTCNQAYSEPASVR